MVWAGGCNEATVLRVLRRSRSVLMTSTALQATVSLVLALPAQAQLAPNARPTGGVVVGGAASISQTSNNTAVNQSSQRAAVNWQSFNVGSQQSVTFNQPSTQSVTLNRVVGPDPSQIAGRIDANGQVVLVNQSGVTFYKGAQVNTNGLMVSAIGMTNQSVKNFISGGQLGLDQPGNPNAAVVNNGKITIRQAGIAALVAPQVANNGTITAQLGHVILAGAKTATLDLYGDGLLSLDVNNQVTQVPVGRDGKTATALVTNTGTIIADGGTVQLTARAADGIVQNLVQAGGKIRAATIGEQTGMIALNGVGGSIVVEGQLSAAGAAPGTKGGAIGVVTDGNVTATSTAKINASGKAGGGTVAIGTTLARAKGGPSVTPTLTAKNVLFQQGAVIAANATAIGNGGRVTVLSTGTTVMNGTIAAMGGPEGGDGGFVETSGAHILDIGPIASVNAAAPHGAGGQWLLDPDSDVLITNSGTTESVSCVAGVCSPTSDSSLLFASTITTALNGGTSVTVTTNNPAGTQTGNITVGVGGTDGEIQLKGTTAVSLSLDAGAGGGAGSITINAPITDAGSLGALSLILSAPNGSGGITLGNDVTVRGNITMSAAGTIALGFGEGAVALTAGAGSRISLVADNLTEDFGSTVSVPNGIIEIAPFTQGTSVTLGGSGGLSLLQSTLSSMTTGTLRIGGATISGSPTISAGSIVVSGTAGIDLTGIATTLELEAAAVKGATGGITVSGPVTVPGNAYLQSGGPGGITVADSIAAGTSVGLQTDAFNMMTGGTITAGVFEFAPNTPGTGITLGAAGVGLSLPSLTGINAADVRIGAVTEPGIGSLTTTAGSINIAGAFGNSNVSVELDATGNVTEATSASLTTNDLTGAAASFSLHSPTNAIAEIDTITATSGDITIVDNTALLPTFAARTLVLSGTHSARDIFYEDVEPGGTLALGIFLGEGRPIPVTLTAAAGSRISLVADNIATVTGDTSSSINAPSGRVELAPFSAINTSLLGTNGLVIGQQLLSFITPTGTLVIGGFANAPVGATAPAPSASSVSIDSLINLTGTATTLDLLATGAVTQPGGPVTVNTLIGDTGSTTLSNTGDDISTLGTFAATTGGFTLADNGNTGTLLVTGPVTAATNIALSTGATGGVSASGAIDAGTTLSIVTGSGGIALVNGGGLTGATVDLSSTGGVSEVAGAMITAGTLQSSGGISGGAARLAGANNAIAALGDFAVSGNTFSLSDTGPLAVDGAVSASSVTIGGAAGSTPFGISLAGTGSVAAPGMTLAAGNGGISIGGGTSLGQAGATVGLSTTGAVTEASGGGVIAGTLSVTGSMVSLSSVSNEVSALGNSTATSFSLADNGNTGTLLVTGPVTAATNIALSTGATGGVSASGAIDAGTTLSIVTGSGGIALVNGGGLTGATVDLSSTGGVSEVAGAMITAGTLQSSGGISGGAARLAGANNAIAALGDFAVSGNTFSLSDTGPLAVDGAVSASSVTIGGAAGSTPFGISLAGTGSVAAPGMTLAAGNGGISIGGGTSLGQAGATVGLSTTGAVTEASGGGVIAGTLSVTGSMVSLSSVSNEVSALGNSTATSFSLADNGNTGTLLVTGPVTAATNIALSTGATGGVSASGAIDAGTTLSIVTGSGGIALVNGGGLTGATVDLSSTGGVSEVAGAMITAGTLQSSGGISGGAARLAGANNAIAALGDFAVSGNTFSLSDTGPLAVDGAVSASSVTIGGAAGSTPFGISLAGTGSVAAPGMTLAAGNGGISIGGGTSLGQAGATVGLSTTGAVTEASGGGVIAGTLSVTGSMVSLSSVSNEVSALGNSTATSFSLADNGNTGTLLVTGPVTAATNIALSTGATGGVSASGAIDAGTTLSIVTGSGGIALVNGGGLTGATVDLSSTGGVSEVAGAMITAGTLQSSGGISGGAARLAGANNAIAALGDFAVSGNTFSLSDTGPLAVDGAVSASSVTIGGAAGSTPFGISLAGTGSVAAPGMTLAAGNGGISIGGGTSLGQAGATVGLSTTGAVTEASGGGVIAGTLSVTGSMVSLSSVSNEVSALGNSTATSFSLYDGTDLLIAAMLNAAQIALLAPNNLILLGNGANIITGGVTPPIPGPINPAEEPSNGAPGAFIEAVRFSQIGSSTLAGQGGEPATLEINISTSASFDPPLGLFAPNGWLILNLGNGTAIGNVFVNALNVTHTTPGGATLAGTIDGISGPAASIIGANQPTIGPAYTFNGCEIGAGCPAPTQVTTELTNGDITSALGGLYEFDFLPGAAPSLVGLPRLVVVTLPLLPAVAPSLTDPDVVPPNITYQDY